MAWQLPKRKRKDSGGRKGTISPASARKALIIGGAVILVASVMINIFLLKRPQAHRKAVAPQRAALAAFAAPKEPKDAASEISGRWYGLCPKNAIHSIEDFHRIVDNDPLLARHFADFDWKNARMGHLEKTIWTHVTYRKDGMILLTRRAIRLPKGDGYITDGNRWVRTYCGNDYVLAGSKEQTTDAVDTDFDRLVKRTDNIPIKEWGARDVVDVTPEPNTFLLVIAGFTALALVRVIRRRME